MHSRKPRLNDGYYENQGRSFQNSKYSRYSNDYRYSRDSSPKRVAISPPEGSPRDGRDRSYHQSSSYRSKDRERDYKKEKYPDKRGRDRDVDYKNYSKKAKTRDRSSSDEEHKESERLYDKARYGERDLIRRGPEKERRVGDWKEMISKGSGKKYYYNERDKSSQWEKPEEWTEYELAKEPYPTSRGYREKDRERKSRDDRYNSGGRRSYSSSKHSRGNSRARWPHDSYGAQPSTSSSVGHHKRHDDNADMDISPESTPTSEPSYASPTATNQHVNSSNINSNSLNHDDSVMTSPNGHSKHPSGNNQLHHQMSNASSSSISSANRLLLNSNKNSTMASSPSTHNYSSYHSSHHHRHRSVSPNDLNPSAHYNNVGHESNNMHHNSNSLRNSPSYGGINNNVTNASGGLMHSTSRIDSNNTNHLIGEGPPTPEMDLNSAGDHRRNGAGVSSLPSVLSSSQASNRLNLLTPSLSKFFRADLISHVTNWPSEMLEKQAQKCAEDVYLLGDLDCSRISAEIQCTRSIVRVAEIAATIQSQRRLFLQEQIKSLEESQTQNSSTISY